MSGTTAVCPRTPRKGSQKPTESLLQAGLLGKSCWAPAGRTYGLWNEWGGRARHSAHREGTPAEATLGSRWPDLASAPALCRCRPQGPQGPQGATVQPRQAAAQTPGQEGASGTRGTQPRLTRSARGWHEPASFPRVWGRESRLQGALDIRARRGLQAWGQGA